MRERTLLGPHSQWPERLHPSLERAAHESKSLELFWNCLLPHGKTFPAQAALFSTTSWTGAVHNLSCRNTLVRVALLANAFGLAGQLSGQPSLTVQGWRLYGWSLQAVARTLLDRGKSDWGETLAASGLLASYEVRNHGSYPC